MSLRRGASRYGGRAHKATPIKRPYMRVCAVRLVHCVDPITHLPPSSGWRPLCAITFQTQCTDIHCPLKAVLSKSTSSFRKSVLPLSMMALTIAIESRLTTRKTSYCDALACRSFEFASLGCRPWRMPGYTSSITTLKRQTASNYVSTKFFIGFTPNDGLTPNDDLVPSA